MAFAFEGTVSSGTMRPEDLIPCFLSALDDLKEDLALSVRPGDEIETAKRIGELDDLLGRIERDSMSPDYFDADAGDCACCEDLDLLFDALESFAPEGMYFGSHPGDGCDYGFWFCEDDAASE